MKTSRMLGNLLGLLLVWASVQASPQEATRSPATGDAGIDRQLVDIDRYGARYRDTFVDELVRYHGAPREFVLVLIDRDWPAGDIYYACALANVAGRPCRYVADRYANGDVVDWQAIAQQLGVEPDSAQFRRLKRGVEATYRRWGRPLPPEANVLPPRPVAAPRGGLSEPPPAHAPGRRPLPIAVPEGQPSGTAAKRRDKLRPSREAEAPPPRR